MPAVEASGATIVSSEVVSSLCTLGATVVADSVVAETPCVCVVLRTVVACCVVDVFSSTCAVDVGANHVKPTRTEATPNENLRIEKRCFVLKISFISDHLLFVFLNYFSYQFFS